MSSVSMTACEWRVGPVASLTHGDMTELRIVERAQRDGTVLYAVTRGGWVANRDRRWELEPIPSSRDDAFIARCRFEEWTEAAALAQWMAKSPSLWAERGTAAS